MEECFMVFVCVCLGILIAATIIFLVGAVMSFLYESAAEGIGKFLLACLCGLFAVCIYIEIRLSKKNTYHEIEVRQVQIDTIYTTTNGKVDTTYVVKYIKEEKK